MRRGLLVRGVGLVVCVAVALWLVVASDAFAAGDANVAGCGNESFAGFTPFLPDCRAFERVSSPFVDGNTASYFVVSSDGSRALEASLGVRAGVESGSNNSVYGYRRSQAGWQVSGLNPSSSLLQVQRFKAVSPDLERTLWFGRKAGESQTAENAYVREADGAVAEVGPLVPGYATQGPPAGEYQEFGNRNVLAYADASGDVSRFLFTTTVEVGQLWKEVGDTTFFGHNGHAKSLYEYAGTNNSHPELVGVSDGSTVVKGATLPAGRLISDCTTELGSTGKDDLYNAMSKDGETVFFTAEGETEEYCGQETAEHPGLVAPVVNELYARVGRAHTIPVSEPTVAACSVCVTPESVAGGRRPAEFAGASEDGSKVLFLTEQELFAGDSSMNLYMYDFANPEGSKVLRVSVGSVEPKVLGVMRVSGDGSHVYFVAEGVLTGGQENENGEVATAGADNLYVFARDAADPAGKVTFVARLANSDEQAPTFSWAGLDRRQAQVTPDGRFLVFASHAHLVPGDASNETATQVFEYDAQSGEMVRVSAGEAGYGEGEASADGTEASILEPPATEATKPTQRFESLVVSDDGGTVMFADAGLLTRSAAIEGEAGLTSFYVYRSPGSAGQIGKGRLFLLSGAKGSGTQTGLLELTPSGGDAFFESAAALAGVAPSSGAVTWDARVGGGFAAVEGPPACVGEGCLGLKPGVGVFGGGESEGTVAGGNALTPAVAPAAPKVSGKAQRLRVALRACRKGRRRARGACERRARARFAVRGVLRGHAGKRGKGWS